MSKSRTMVESRVRREVKSSKVKRREEEKVRWGRSEKQTKVAEE